MIEMHTAKALPLTLLLATLASCALEPSGGRRGERDGNDVVSSGRGDSTPEPGTECPSPSPAAIADAQGAEAASSFRLSLTTPTYWGEIKPVIDMKCTWCHSAAAAPDVRHRPYLTTYANVVAEAEDVRDEVKDGKMPPRNRTPRPSGDETRMLEEWFANGMPEGTPPAPIDPSRPVYYEDTIRALLASSCVGCHGAAGKAPRLDGYDAAKLAAPSALSAVETGRMPPSGALSDDAKAALKAWVNAGTPYDASGTTPPPISTPPDCSN